MNERVKQAQTIETTTLANLKNRLLVNVNRQSNPDADIKLNPIQQLETK
jgi:hypothetical protein